jgi:hypothetical protein
MTDKTLEQPLLSSSRLASNKYGRKQLSYTGKILLLFIFQAFLALFVNQVSQISTLHAYATLAVGAYFLLSDKEPYRLVNWLGYMVGAELLWRGMGANVFWETAKYSIIVICILGFFKNFGKHSSNFSLIPYFLLLVPSVFLLRSFDREAIAFALAGPLAMAAASLFFSRIEINTDQLKSLLLIMLASVLTFSILVFIGIIDAENIEFSGVSNYLTSANTGPNQVSSLLSFGALAAFVYAFFEREYKFLRFIVVLLGIALFTQIALTFSRGGLWTLLGALAAAGVFFIRDKKVRRNYLLVVVISFLIFTYLILPLLDNWTYGAIGARIRDTEPTGRLEIIQSDWEVFLENPMFGVGVGGSNIYHARYFRIANAHTEYTRMLAEHGVFGLASLLIFIISILARVLGRNDTLNKAVVVACLTWGLLFMAHSATRLAAPMLLIGLAYARFDLSIPISETTPENRFHRFRHINPRFLSRKS